MKLLLTAMICFLLVQPVFPSEASLEDSTDNRLKHAQRYLDAVPPKGLMANMAHEMAKTLPESQRPLFISMMTKHLDIEAFTDTIRSALVKHFTADELRALGDFYGSAVGKSAMSKFGAFMADYLPKVNKLTQQAAEKAAAELKKPTGSEPPTPGKSD